MRHKKKRLRIKLKLLKGWIGLSPTLLEGLSFKNAKTKLKIRGHYMLSASQIKGIIELS